MIFHEINHPAIGDFPFMETPIEQPWNSPATWRHWPVTNILRIHVVFCQLLAVRATDGAKNQPSFRFNGTMMVELVDIQI
jgi:hypothetical protein